MGQFRDSAFWQFFNRHGFTLWNASGFLMATSVALGFTNWTVAEIVTNSVLLVTSLIYCPFLWAEGHRVRFWISVSLVVSAAIGLFLAAFRCA